eukprot:COSAG01_NODE_561_length_15460_cov_95.444307_13_plen_69_part_00
MRSAACLPQAMDAYEVGDVLGRGAFGVAIKVVRKVDRREFAVKQVDISAMPESEQREAKMEAPWSTLE